MNDSFLLGKTIQNPSREQRACLLRASVLKKQSTNQSLRTSRERNDSAAGAKSQMTQTPSLPLACLLPLCVVCKTKTNNETYMYWTMRSRKGVFPIVCVCVCACVYERGEHTATTAMSRTNLGVAKTLLRATRCDDVKEREKKTGKGIPVWCVV